MKRQISQKCAVHRGEAANFALNSAQGGRPQAQTCGNVGVKPLEAPRPPEPALPISKEEYPLLFRDFLWRRNIFGDPSYPVAEPEREHYPTHRVRFAKGESAKNGSTAEL